MNKIDIPQILVSYPQGTGGEWLAYQIGQHPELYHYHNGELEGETNKFNRWRITPSWRGYMLDFTDWQDQVWMEEDFDGSQTWWDRYYARLPDLEPYYNKARELIQEKQDCKITVHRTHEAWQDQAWSGLFENLKTVTIKIDDTDPIQLGLLQSNIIRKIWSQEFYTVEDLDDEIIDKCRKLDVDYDQAMSHIIKFSGTVNYTDMMFALFLAKTGNPNSAMTELFNNLSGRWNEYTIRQHWCELPNQFVLNYRRLFIDRDYREYLKMCDFLEISPYTETQWKNNLDTYMDNDLTNYTTIENLEDRLWMRFSEI